MNDKQVIHMHVLAGRLIQPLIPQRAPVFQKQKVPQKVKKDRKTNTTRSILILEHLLLCVRPGHTHF